MNQTNALGRVFVSHLCHSGQTHRFRRCSVAAMGAFKYHTTNSKNGNKEELHFTLLKDIIIVQAISPVFSILAYLSST